MAKILYIGHFYKGSTENSRLIDLSQHYEVSKYDLSRHFPLWRISTSSIFRKINFGPPFFNVFLDLKNIMENDNFSLILLEKNNFLNAKRIKILFKKNNSKIIMFCHDNVLYKKNKSPILHNSISLFDGIITTKKNNVDYFKNNGCKNIFLINNAASYIHSKRFIKNLTKKEKSFMYDVGFIGRWEKEREELFYKLSRDLEFNFIVAGPGWEKVRRTFPKNLTIKPPLWGNDYFNLITNIKINIALNSKIVNDTQTTRTIELSAYSGFLLAEKTKDTQEIFGKELNNTLFKDFSELKQKINFYLKNDVSRFNDKKLQYKRIKEKKLYWYYILPNLLDKFI